MTFRETMSSAGAHVVVLDICCSRVINNPECVFVWVLLANVHPDGIEDYRVECLMRNVRVMRLFLAWLDHSDRNTIDLSSGAPMLWPKNPMVGHVLCVALNKTNDDTSRISPPTRRTTKKDDGMYICRCGCTRVFGLCIMWLLLP